jgi:hypothetical protein
VSLCPDNNEWQNHTSFPNREIPWHDAGRQIALEGACQDKKRTAWPKIQKHVLAYGTIIGHINTKQADALQIGTEARVDLWHPAMGLHEAEQHRHNTAISKQSTQKHIWCALVRSERCPPSGSPHGHGNGRN